MSDAADKPARNRLPNRRPAETLQIEQKLTDCEARLRAMKVAAAAEAKNTTILATRLQDWLTRTVSAVKKLGETK